MKLSQADTLRVARSVIRDMAHGWTVKELQAPPVDVCAALSAILGETYNFETGNVERENK
jgi:hypothetical protein